MISCFGFVFCSEFWVVFVLGFEFCVLGSGFWVLGFFFVLSLLVEGIAFENDVGGNFRVIEEADVMDEEFAVF